MANLLRRIRQGIADTLRAVADGIEPPPRFRPGIVWGPSIADTPIDYSQPIHIPDEWLDWPGKAEGSPRPRAVFYRGERQLPRDTVECRAIIVDLDEVEMVADELEKVDGRFWQRAYYLSLASAAIRVIRGKDRD